MLGKHNIFSNNGQNGIDQRDIIPSSGTVLINTREKWSTKLVYINCNILILNTQFYTASIFLLDFLFRKSNCRHHHFFERNTEQINRKGCLTGINWNSISKQKIRHNYGFCNMRFSVYHKKKCFIWWFKLSTRSIRKSVSERFSNW